MARARVLAAVLFLLVAGAGSTVFAQTRVVITVDVESQVLPLPNQVDAVCAGGVPCGLIAMVSTLTERGLAGTFFLDVYEHRQWGQPALRGIATRLAAAGQDVELHTHPQWAYDPRRVRMENYTLEEQTAIVRDGAALLSSWTGQPIVAHRAGDYGADDRTLEALRRNGIVVDSSLFFANARSPLNSLGMPRNVPSTRGGIFQIPVTVYERDAHPRWLGESVAPLRSIRKIDPDWFIDGAEATAALDALVDARTPYVVVFLHSFTYLVATDAASVPVANVHSIENFRTILDHIARRRLPVVTMRQVAASAREVSTAADVVPAVRATIGLPSYAWQRGRAAGLGAVVGMLVGLVLAAVVVVWSIRRLARRSVYAPARIAAATAARSEAGRE